ncbi:MAG TPA: ATP-dependent DNA helicase RecG [Caldisericia bacterium]|nr:ATP-dependent DNA helicase RecG [Caldisericia bacterium]HPF49014.1 ATP-dependent DNA helicase RecG [Caldisericia bacterium]HPI83122.1 ATP-dependent DNA helicase RecG [Caldisericia bacterium]HPQ92349.1 ATP-dependent DNA helicase RecG [Caldisericia bacterium]HRV74553.1 ATP-dependent DNA helicase RecG [Caldisericia bacterium]
MTKKWTREQFSGLIETEIKRGYDNKAVVSGLDSLVPEFLKDLKDNPSDSYKARFVKAFANYNKLEIDKRATLLKSFDKYLDWVLSPYYLPKKKINTKGKQLLLTDPVTKVRGVGENYAEKLYSLGISTVFDLLMHLPTRYIDYTKIDSLADAKKGNDISVHATVLDIQLPRKNRNMINVLFGDKTGRIRVTWFNNPWILKKIAIGKSYTITGRVIDYGGLNLVNPDIRDGFKAGKIVPIYPSTKGVTQFFWEKAFSDLLARMPEIGDGSMSSDVLEHFKLKPLEDSVVEIHRPSSIKFANSARNRIAIEELALLQAALIKRRETVKKEPGILVDNSIEASTNFMDKLPFEPTNAQKRCVEEIATDLKSGCPMNRLLHGDVGSGKTVVGFAAANTLLGKGHQVAWIAPTEVLATQTYKGAKSILDYDVLFLSGSSKKADREIVKENLETGKPLMLIGTHAILEDWVEFVNLGLAVVDEQHRFGVTQRANLIKKGKVPHVLVMSATPIPRTLALTVYGDLEVSYIDQMPKGRKPITTKIVKSKEAYDFANRELTSGSQVFVVCPLVEESEKLDAVSATEMFEDLRQGHFKNYRCELLHGKMKNDEKNRVMERFKSGESQVLISTTVIEVGIDVPNATVMIIENAERFGLAQLHQLRGRVGRGEKAGYCFLLPSKPSQALMVLEQTNNGLEVAEEDLKIRGPGDIGGTLQSGVPLISAGLITPGNQDLLLKAREIAEYILNDDPDLSSIKNRRLKETIEQRMSKRVGMAWVS